jgi:hypothetical protein
MKYKTKYLDLKGGNVEQTGGGAEDYAIYINIDSFLKKDSTTNKYIPFTSLDDIHKKINNLVKTTNIIINKYNDSKFYDDIILLDGLQTNKNQNQNINFVIFCSLFSSTYQFMKGISIEHGYLFNILNSVDFITKQDYLNLNEKTISLKIKLDKYEIMYIPEIFVDLFLFDITFISQMTNIENITNNLQFDNFYIRNKLLEEQNKNDMDNIKNNIDNILNTLKKKMNPDETNHRRYTDFYTKIFNNDLTKSYSFFNNNNNMTSITNNNTILPLIAILVMKNTNVVPIKIVTKEEYQNIQYDSKSKLFKKEKLINFSTLTDKITSTLV